MNKLWLLLIFIFLISNVFALCEENQIDINSASKEELDGLYGIGPVKAGEIINSRPFESINELIKVNGIGNITLNKIKEQGLACVEKEAEEIEEQEINEKNNDVEENKKIVDNIKESPPKDIELEVINLSTKIIKGENDKEDLNKNNYAIYGLVFFCVLLGVLFILRKNKYEKNEFT